MSSLAIVRYPADVLKARAVEISDFGRDLEDFAEKMFQTMIDNDGVGLAAPQVGISKRMFIAAPEGKKGPRYFYINPEILSGDGKDIGPEGCLSFPGVYSDVERFKEIRVRYHDLKGNQQEEKIKGFLARIFQHENDHLDGVLFVEHLGFEQRKLVLDDYRRLQGITL